MKTAAFEGIVDNDRIRLPEDVHLPDKTKVYVVVPDFDTKKAGQIVSPRLVHPEQASRFKKRIIERPRDDKV